MYSDDISRIPLVAMPGPIRSRLLPASTNLPSLSLGLLLLMASLVFGVFLVSGCDEGSGCVEGSGCDEGAGSPSAPDSPSGHTEFKQHLVDYNRTVEEIFAALEGYVQDVQALAVALEGAPVQPDQSAWEGIDDLVDRLVPALDAAEVAAVALLETEQAIRRGIEQAQGAAQKSDHQSGGQGPFSQGSSQEPDGYSRQKILVTAVGVTLLVGGLIEFCKSMRASSDKVIEARERRDEALGRIVDDPGDDQALDDYHQAREDMVEGGQEVLTELGSKIVVDSALHLVPTARVVRTAVKDRLGNELQGGLKVLSATHTCGLENNERCRIGLATTKDPTDPDGTELYMPGEPSNEAGVLGKLSIRYSGSSDPADTQGHIVRMGYDDLPAAGFSEEDAARRESAMGRVTYPGSVLTQSGYLVPVPIPLATPALVATLDEGICHPDLIQTLGDVPQTPGGNGGTVEGSGSCRFGMSGHELCWQYPRGTSSSDGSTACGYMDGGSYSNGNCAPGLGNCTVVLGVTYLYYYVGSAWTAQLAQNHCESPYTWGSGVGGTWSAN